MTNEEKAKEIAENRIGFPECKEYGLCDEFKDCYGCRQYYAAMQMAEWKDEKIAKNSGKITKRPDNADLLEMIEILKSENADLKRQLSEIREQFSKGLKDISTWKY